MGILEIVSNIIKNKFNAELIYSEKYLKAEKTHTNKMRLSIFIWINNIN